MSRKKENTLDDRLHFRIEDFIKSMMVVIGIISTAVFAYSSLTKRIDVLENKSETNEIRMRDLGASIKDLSANMLLGFEKLGNQIQSDKDKQDQEMQDMRDVVTFLNGNKAAEIRLDTSKEFVTKKDRTKIRNGVSSEHLDEH